MNNHYHLIVETERSLLSRGMQVLNGRYAQLFNQRHDREGAAR
jgi:putative transposase